MIVDNVDMQEKREIDNLDERVDFSAAFAVLWAGKWVILLSTCVAAILSILYALSLPNTYKSDALLSPSSQESGGLGNLARQYGGLASLAGLSLSGGGGGDKTQIGLKILKSRTFIGGFITDRDILVPLMAGKQWDVKSRELTLDPGIYDQKTERWLLDDVDTGKYRKPSSQEAYKALTELLSVNHDRVSGFVTVGIEHLSPILAQQWVSWLVEDLNDAVRQQKVDEAKRSIKYLESQIKNTSLTEMQSMFYELIQSQTEVIMLASVRKEYLFQTIDPAIVPELKVGPVRSIICILGTLLGSLLGLVLVVLVHSIRNLKAQPMSKSKS